MPYTLDDLISDIVDNIIRDANEELLDKESLSARLRRFANTVLNEY